MNPNANKKTNNDNASQSEDDDDDDDDESDSDVEYEDEPLEPKILPSRSTRGRRFNKLVSLPPPHHIPVFLLTFEAHGKHWQASTLGCPLRVARVWLGRAFLTACFVNHLPKPTHSNTSHSIVVC